jgi:hypothetical protein
MKKYKHNFTFKTGGTPEQRKQLKELLTDRTIIATRYDPASIDPDPKVIFIREIKQNDRH